VIRKIMATTAVGLATILTAASCSSTPSTDTVEDDVEAEPTYGNCEVTGEFGSDPITEPTTADTFTVENSLPSPGWWNGDKPANIKDGYEYCMAANIAYRGGLSKLDVKTVSFASIVAGQTKDFDLALVTISITPEREQAVEFTPPYFSGDVGVLTKKGNEVTSESIKESTVGVQLSTVGQSFAIDKLGIAEGSLKVFPDTGSMTTALASGQVDVVLNDTAQALTVASASNGLLEVVGQFSTGESYGGVYPEGAPNKEAIDKIITDLIDDGTLKDLAATYLAPVFGSDPTDVPYLDIPQ
jgi:polar amino acid transport system substrate-binding protein